MKNKYNIGDIVYICTYFEIKKIRIASISLNSQGVIVYGNDNRLVGCYEEHDLFKNFDEAKTQAIFLIDKYCEVSKKEIENLKPSSIYVEAK